MVGCSEGKYTSHSSATFGPLVCILTYVFFCKIIILPFPLKNSPPKNRPPGPKEGRPMPDTYFAWCEEARPLGGTPQPIAKWWRARATGTSPGFGAQNKYRSRGPKPKPYVSFLIWYRLIPACSGVDLRGNSVNPPIQQQEN